MRRRAANSPLLAASRTGKSLRSSGNHNADVSNTDNARIRPFDVATWQEVSEPIRFALRDPKTATASKEAAPVSTCFTTLRDGEDPCCMWCVVMFYSHCGQRTKHIVHSDHHLVIQGRIRRGSTKPIFLALFHVSPFSSLFADLRHTSAPLLGFLSSPSEAGKHTHTPNKQRGEKKKYL